MRAATTFSALLSQDSVAAAQTRSALDASQAVWSDLTQISPTGWLLAVSTAVAVGLGLSFVLRVLIRRFERLAQRTRTEFDDLAVQLLSRTRRLFVFLVAVWLGSRTVDLPPALNGALRGLLVVGLFLQGGLWANGVVNHLLTRYRRHQLEEDPTSATALGAVAFLARTSVWAIVFLLVVANLGFDVTALITGLGIGGIAIALAVQNVLGDLFASLAIVLDKPFVVGDFIAVDGMNGTVEHVGVKTTRVRSLSGEQLIFGNANLLGTSIRNYGRLRERRIVFTIGVEYATPREKLKAIPGWLRQAVEAQKQTRFDRAHLRSFGDSAIEFEVVYYVLEPNYALYMDVQQAINLVVHEVFEREGIEFAFPSRTVFLRGLEPVADRLRAGGGGRSDPDERGDDSRG